MFPLKRIKVEDSDRKNSEVDTHRNRKLPIIDTNPRPILTIDLTTKDADPLSINRIDNAIIIPDDDEVDIKPETVDIEIKCEVDKEWSKINLNEEIKYISPSSSDKNIQIAHILDVKTETCDIKIENESVRTWTDVDLNLEIKEDDPLSLMEFENDLLICNETKVKLETGESDSENVGNKAGIDVCLNVEFEKEDHENTIGASCSSSEEFKVLPLNTYLDMKKKIEKMECHLSKFLVEKEYMAYVIRNLNAKVRTLKEENTENGLDTLKKHLKHLENEVTISNAKVQESESQTKSLVTEISGLQQYICLLSNINTKLKNELDVLKDTTKLREDKLVNEVNGLEKYTCQLSNNNAKLRGELFELKQTAKQRDERIQTLLNKVPQPNNSVHEQNCEVRNPIKNEDSNSECDKLKDMLCSLKKETTFVELVKKIEKLQQMYTQHKSKPILGGEKVKPEVKPELRTQEVDFTKGKIVKILQEKQQKMEINLI